MKDIVCDLHIHTSCSDGGKDASLIIDKVRQKGVKIISITDHNNVDAYNKLKDIDCNDTLIITGVECDVVFENSILHILMYDFDLDNEVLKQFFDNLRKDDIINFEKMIDEVCRKYRLNISKEDAIAFEKNNGYFDKVRLNNFLVSLGYAKDPQAAYYNFTKDIADKKRRAIPAESFFHLARKCNAVTILAHPFKYLNGDLEKIEALILRLQKMGLNGIEVFSNRQSTKGQKLLYKFAKANNLEYCGGSDYHQKIGQNEKKEIGRVLGQKITLNMFSQAFLKIFSTRLKKN